MNANQLRVYHEPVDTPAAPLKEGSVKETDRDLVTVPLSEVLPLLADAVASQRTWLRDFEDDEMTISMDLYEVLLAYQHYRRPSA